MAGTLHLTKSSKFIGKSALALAIFGALAGCVPQDKYNALKLDRDGLAEQLTKSQADEQAAQAQADSYKSQLAQLMNNGSNSTALLANLNKELADLQAQYNDLNTKYAEAMNRPAMAGSPLPPALTSELEAFARENPDLVSFDASKGVVKFKNDVLFSPGETTLKPEALDAIAKFATILNSQAAAGYELLVAGHTDNQRVTNPRTIAAGNKDNWYLSAHRAIAVADKLMTEHVSPQRIGVCGYADQRPAAPNTTPANMAQNRRVEVLILPTMVKGTGVSESTPPPMKPMKMSAKSPMNKDSAGSEMNK